MSFQIDFTVRHASPMRWAAYLALLRAERKLELAGLEIDARAVREIRRRLS